MRLLICDSFRLVLDALGMALTDHGHTVVATALDPDEACEAAMIHQPDVCLLGLNNPLASGLNAIGRIRAISPHTKVVILSDSMDAGFVASAITHGAQGIVSKRKPIGAILLALEEARQGQLAVEAPVLQEVFRHFAAKDDPLRMLKFLTHREWQALRCIMDGLSTHQIADELGVRPGTAHAHVQNLLAKLGVHSRLKAFALMTAHASEETWPAHLR